MANPYSLSPGKYSTHSLLAAWIGKNKKVLDVGCNTWYLWSLCDNSCIFYGLEYMDEAVQIARKSYTNVMQYNLEELKELPWEMKFDVIVFADVLEHVKNPRDILAFFRKYLADNWKIIISLPNVANWQVRFQLLFGNFDDTETGIMDKTHLHYYTFASTKKLLKDAHLDEIRSYGGASFFWPIIDIFPFLNGLLATNVIIEAKISNK